MTSRTTIAAEPGQPVLTMSRTFNAPRERVFQAFTDPEAIPHWWGLRRERTVVEQMDVRPGGMWRYLVTDGDGNEFAFHGEYREITPPERLAYTFEFEGTPGRVLVETVTFEDRGGQTLVTMHSRFASVEDRDGMLESGMQEGTSESWDRLEEYLARA